MNSDFENIFKLPYFPLDQVTPFSQDSRLSIFIDQSLHKIMQQCEDYTDFEPRDYQSTWPNCNLILGTDPDYQNKVCFRSCTI